MRKSSLSSALSAGFAALALAGPSLLGAQASSAPPVAQAIVALPLQAAPAPRPAVEIASAPVAGPVNDATAAAFQTPIARTPRTTKVMDDPHLGAGTNVALMGVGAAGLIAGLLIGGNAGTAVAIGGGLVGLYGLYRYLQ